jgi:hypothetical protein
MSAKTLDPQIKNAPPFLHKYYYGYDPELYKEITILYNSCPSIQVKRKTALKYAKMAQERDLEDKKNEERAKYRGYEFIDFDGIAAGVFESEEAFKKEFRKHIQALVLRISHAYHYAADEVRILVRGYDPYTNVPNTILRSWSYVSVARELEKNTQACLDQLSNSVWKVLMDHDDRNVQKRSIKGWSVFGNNNEHTLFFIDFKYDDNLEKLIELETEQRKEEEMKKRRLPDAMGYGGTSGKYYTGD